MAQRQAVNSRSHSTASPGKSHRTTADAEPVASAATPDDSLIKTTSSSPEISTAAEQAQKVAPATTDNNAMPSPSLNTNSVNGAAQPKVSTDLVRALIAEKTGYPAEMIEDDMDLSGELGIDSIKQVEVFSALRKQVPGIKDVGTADMGQLRTIRQIADFFG